MGIWRGGDWGGDEKFKSGEKGIDWLVMWEWLVSVWKVNGTSGLGRMVG